MPMPKVSIYRDEQQKLKKPSLSYATVLTEMSLPKCRIQNIKVLSRAPRKGESCMTDIAVIQSILQGPEVTMGFLAIYLSGVLIQLCIISLSEFAYKLFWMWQKKICYCSSLLRISSKIFSGIGIKIWEFIVHSMQNNKQELKTRQPCLLACYQLVFTCL